MAIYQFLDFTFCDQSYQLKRSNTAVQLRPKTANALHYFLQYPNQLVSKNALYLALWQSDQVQDYRVFQVVSELRKLAPSAALIRTQPNEGYIWQAKVTINQKAPKKLVYSTAASLLVVAMGLVALFKPYSQDIPNKALMPAQGSYANAILAFNKAHYVEAEKWLQFSLRENPDSIDARLLLAEINLQLQNPYIAAEIAQQVAEASTISPYYHAQALDLMSRVAFQNNQLDHAIDFAQQGQKHLERSQAICSAQVLDKRIANLFKTKNNNRLTHQSDIQNNDAVSNNSMGIALNANEKLSQLKENTELCQQLSTPATSKVECDSLIELDISRNEQQSIA